MGLAFPAAPRLLERASAETGVDVRRALERGGRALRRTEVLQPTLVAVAWACAEALREAGVPRHASAGHSLGALTAAAWSAGLPADEAIALAAERGRRMAEHAGGGMLALRAGAAEVAAALPEGLTVAAENAPDETVVSGPKDALRAFATSAPWPSRPLDVSGAWHSPAMAPAVAPIRAALRRAFGPGVADALAEDVVRPVRFVSTLEGLARDGVTDLVLVAPGRVARGLARRTLGARVRLHLVSDPAAARAVDVGGRDP